MQLRKLSTGLAVLLASSCLAHARELTFEARVKAQEAIERAYYRHQIGTVEPFEAAVPRALLEEKVQTYLKESIALERFWKTPVTADMLRGELDRMARDTRLPARLGELYEALGNDSFVVQECLARPAIVARLAHDLYASDPSIHEASRRRAEALRGEILGRSIDPFRASDDRVVFDLVDAGEDTAARPDTDPTHSGGRAEVRVPHAAWVRKRSAFPVRSGVPGAISESTFGFSWSVLLYEAEGRARIAVWEIPKRSWSSWWTDVSGSLDALSVRATADDGDRLPPPRVGDGSGPALGGAGTGAAQLADDTWDPGLVPRGRIGSTTIWTGTRMIVWGGMDVTGSNVNSGASYDPAIDGWTPTATEGAPSGRSYHTAVWAKQFMVVWGGTDGSYLNTGGRYDPVTDRWMPITTVGAPSARWYHASVAVGNRALVWGGIENTGLANTGGIYDATLDSWTSTSTVGAPEPRYNTQAVWTGKQVIVWGGQGELTKRFNTGGRYDPATDSWTPTSMENAPSVRSDHTMVWAGSTMIVWGGYSGHIDLISGAIYNPSTDHWKPTPIAAGMPAGRSAHVSVWTGKEMIVWGGQTYHGLRRDGGVYDPVTETWRKTSLVGAPDARYRGTAVWTGSEMLVWGGSGYGEFAYLDGGGRYDPATDTWRTLSGAGSPEGKVDSAAVWTGNLFLVFGGTNSTGTFYDLLGLGRYDPTTDVWEPISRVGAPSFRWSHTGVWTGHYFVVWGGVQDSQALSSGARYDPIRDRWTPTATLGAPSPRWNHAAIWTGDRMVVWGGTNLGTLQNTGALYDPESDRWTPTSQTGAPPATVSASAVWTGSRMILWGGYDGTTFTAAGWRYDPTGDTWAPTSSVGAPSGRFLHTALWTGDRMIVWGGLDPSGAALDTGGIYDPVSDAWGPVSTSGAPTGRWTHSAVWTGAEMIVWGGHNAAYTYTSTGGRYDPGTGLWRATSAIDAPFPRGDHVAAWTGDVMLIWGGSDLYHTFPMLGRYVAIAP